MKKIKYQTKQRMPTSEPIQMDESWPEKIEISFKDQSVKVHMALIDSDGGRDKDDNPIPIINGRRPVIMGLEDYGRSVNIDKLIKETLDAVNGSGRIPNGGKIEE